jgi:hypothetical protein
MARDAAIVMRGLRAQSPDTATPRGVKPRGVLEVCRFTACFVQLGWTRGSHF